MSNLPVVAAPPMSDGYYGKTKVAPKALSLFFELM